MEEAALLSATDRIKKSRKLNAYERAWEVAHALENDRIQFGNLQWVEPAKDPIGRMRRRPIDFDSEFPEGVTPFTPISLDVCIVAPSHKIAPDDDLAIQEQDLKEPVEGDLPPDIPLMTYSLPILTRMKKWEGDLDSRVKSASRAHSGTGTVRNVIDIVSFLPFPGADVSEDDRFKPEFQIVLRVNAPLEDKMYYGAVLKYGGKCVTQLLSGQDNGGVIPISPDPHHNQAFSAEMLITMSAEQLAATPEGAGDVEIYLYRVREGVDYSALFTKNIITAEGTGGDITDIFSGDRGAQLFSSDSSPTRGGGTPSFDLGYRDLGTSKGGLRPLPSTYDPKPEPSPAEVTKEVGRVSVSAGSKGRRVETGSVTNPVFDSDFGIQPIHIEFLGVREGSYDSARSTLEIVAEKYRD
jgi:hypothetical protein